MDRNKNLREWEPTDSDAKHVDQTKMLNTTARETPDTVTANNSTKEHVTSHPSFGPLGINGRH